MLRITITLGRGRSVNVGKRGNVRPFLFGGGVTTGHTHTALRRGEEEEGELWRRPTLVAKYARSVRSLLLSLSSVHATTKEVIPHTRLMERPFPLSAKPVALSSSERFAFSAIDKCDVISIPPKACRSVLCLTRSPCPSVSTVPSSLLLVWPWGAVAWAHHHT